MKKTNRTFKRFAAITSASLLAACAMAPLATGITSSAAEITITGINAEIAHTFEVYQVFKGDIAADGKTLTNIKWGSGITKYDTTDAVENEKVSETIISDITTTNNAITTLNKITLGTVLKTVSSSGESLTINNLDPGYYVIKDVTTLTDIDDANSAYIVQVLGDVDIAIKKASPKIDKLVQDEVADKDSDSEDTNGWGETADHAINEKYDYKLVATIPADTDYKFYESYKLIFNDTLSTGVVFDAIKSVTVNGTAIETGYISTAVAGDTKKSFTVTIEDLIPILTAQSDTLGGDIIEVIYTAHLNEEATVHNESGDLSDTNKNTVYLEYSNNPDGTGGGDLGKTAPDSVWVFTYQVNNTKYAEEAEEGKELEGAGFTLYNGDTPIKLIYNGDGTYTVADQADDVTVKNDGEELATGDIVTEMISNVDGIFNIKGLDIGTYILKETTTPDGFNTCADETITIKATHEESASGATMTLDETSTMNVKIVNKQGNTLPGTGGIGTTIFYLGGGAMAAIGGVYLISKRRMKKSEE